METLYSVNDLTEVMTKLPSSDYEVQLTELLFN